MVKFSELVKTLCGEFGESGSSGDALSFFGIRVEVLDNVGAAGTVGIVDAAGAPICKGSWGGGGGISADGLAGSSCGDSGGRGIVESSR